MFIKATPEQIWDAITKPEFTERYFHGVRSDFDLRPAATTGRRWATRISSRRRGRCSRPTRQTPLAHVDVPVRPRMPAESRAESRGRSKHGRWTALLTVTHHQLEGAPKTAVGVYGRIDGVLSSLKTLLETGEPL